MKVDFIKLFEKNPFIHVCLLFNGNCEIFNSNDIEISREMSHDTISNNRYVGTQLLNVS